MRTAAIVYQDIKDRFKTWTGKDFQNGSAIDFYTVANSEAMAVAHQEIEANKNPHIFTRLAGDDLDSEGFMVNCPRETGENDAQYKWRLMRWLRRMETGNNAAIQDALLNLDHAASAEFVPFSMGCGTATVYVIPKIYDNVTASLALAEAQVAVNAVKGAGLYVQYVVPTIVAVRPVALMETYNGDITLIRSNIENKFKAYINALAPGAWLEVGQLERIGLVDASVRYFSVLSTYLNGVENKDVSIMQGLSSKFLYDSTTWAAGG